MLSRFFERPFTFDRVARIVFTLLIIGVVLWGVGEVSAVLVPFFMAWLCAYLLMPVVRFFEQRLKIKSRGLSLLIVLLLLGGILTGIVAIVVPSITEEAKKAWELMQYYDLQGVVLSMLPEELRSRTGIVERLEVLLGTVDIKEIVNTVSQVLQSSWSILSDTFGYLKSLGVVLVFFIYMIFIILDYEKLSSGIFKLFPRRVRPFAHEVAGQIEYYMNSYFRGQALIALSCGIIMSVGFYIIGLPMGITLGIFIGVLNLIPYLQVLGYIPMVILCLLQSASTGQSFWLVLLMAAIVVVVGELAQNFILTPSIHGASMGIRPAVILLSLTIWGALLGFLGMLFALPLTMICYSLYMKYVVGEPIQEEEPAPKKRRPLCSIFKKRKEEN